MDNQWAIFLFGGVLLLHLFYMTAYSVIFKKVEFLNYTVYLLLLVPANWFRLKVIYQNQVLISKQDPLWASDLLLFQLASIAYISFTIHFTQAREKSPRYYMFSFSFNRWLLVFVGGGLLLYLAGWIQLKSIYLRIFYFLLFPVFSYNIWLLYKQKSSVSKLVLIGSLVMVLPPSVYFLVRLLLDQNYHIYKIDFQWMLMAAQVLSFVCINFALILTAKHYEEESNRIELQRQKAMEAQRLQISNDLHDDAGATLSSIYLFASLASQLPEEETEKRRNYIETIRSGILKVKNHINNMLLSSETAVPNEIEDFTFTKSSVLDLLKAKNIACKFEIAPPAEAKFEAIMRSPSLRLFLKEALNNIVKHSNASQVLFSANYSTIGLCIKIVDNGVGFVKEQAHKGNGLASMEYRARRLGGQLNIQSMPGQGTSIELELPLQE